MPVNIFIPFLLSALWSIECVITVGSKADSSTHHCLNYDSVQFVPDKLQHQGYSGRERPCYSELHTLLRVRSASAALWDCRKHAPLWRSSVWPDFLFLWNTKQIKKHLWGVNYPLFATNRNEFSTLSTAWVNPFVFLILTFTCGLEFIFWFYTY